MKSTVGFLAAATACSFIVCGCGGEGKSDCQQAVDVQNEGRDAACEDKDEECCFCKCWRDGRQWYDPSRYETDGTCVCTAWNGAGSTGPCTGALLEQAKSCLAEPDACMAAAADLVTNPTGYCTVTPLE
jgi:hypothetical protein